MGERKICYKCMKRYENGISICPYCAYAENTPANPLYIAPGSILHDRYLIGVLTEYNGEGATYIAYDTSIDCTVFIREYMPANLCTRASDHKTINVGYESLAKYKAFMAEFTELNKSLARLRNNSNINPMLDMFSENNTTYAVFEYINGMKMLDYLKENAGELSWEQISKLFPPLFTTLGILHNSGIIHRAISPDTIYITEKGELKLTGFCISAVRTADAGLEYELFKGYTAPEQYSASTNSRQGTWTDVYGVCALMYRSLTGCMPVDSMRRLKEDELCEPRMLSAKIPRHVSRVIMDGMNLSGCDRIQTITELVTRLFEQPVTRTSSQGSTKVMKRVPQPEPTPRRSPKKPKEPKYSPPENLHTDENYRYETVDRLKVPVIIGILLIAILMIIAVFIINMITDTQTGREKNLANRHNATSASDNVVSATEEEVPPEIMDTFMPDLTGKFFEMTADKYKDFFTMEAEYEYNNEYETDMIFWQSIEPDEQIVGGKTTVKVKVSKGRETAIVPAFEGIKIKDYEAKLKEAGISNYSILATKSTKTDPDVVVGLQVEGKDVKPGDTFSNKEGKKLIVYYYSENVTVDNDNIFLGGYSEEYTTEQYTTQPVEITQPVYTEKTTVYIEPNITEPPPQTTEPAPQVTEAPAVIPTEVVTVAPIPENPPPPEPEE